MYKSSHSLQSKFDMLSVVGIVMLCNRTLLDRTNGSVCVTSTLTGGLATHNVYGECLSELLCVCGQHLVLQLRSSCIFSEAFQLVGDTYSC